MDERREQVCRKFFAEMDIDGNGFITYDDFAEAKNTGYFDSKADLDKMLKIIEEGDQDNDGKVSYEEFRTYFMNLGKK